MGKVKGLLNNIISRQVLRALRAAALSICLLASPADAARSADLVFLNGAVYTVENDAPWAQAVAVQDDEIVFVGSDRDVRSYIGRKTSVVDLKGRMLMPGFVDAHGHIGSADTLFDASLTFREQPPEVVIDAVRQYAEEHPDLPFVRGGGWIMEAFGKEGPTAAMIDSYLPDRPAVFKAIDGHHMWVNSKALEIAGIDADTPDPLPGKSWFARDPETNAPTGFIIEHAAMELLKERLTEAGYAFETRERLERGVRAGVPMLSAAGITTLYDAGMKDREMTFSILHAMEQSGELGVRIYGAYVYDPNAPEKQDEDPIEQFADLRKRYHSEFLGTGQIKLFLDGTETNHTAYMMEPFSDKPDDHGEPLISIDQLNQVVWRAEQAGFDMHIHVVGDGAVHAVLNAIELAQAKNGPLDRRHAVAHTILVAPEDIPRFRETGLIWQTTPAWAVMNDRNRTVERIVGEERFNGIYPLQDAVDQGVTLASGSDFTALNPGIIYRPLDQIEIGHNRQPIGFPDTQVMPSKENRLNLPDLIRSYTINGAYMLRRENEIGSLRVGKQADLVILDKNLFDVPRYEIHSVKVEATVMDGRVRYANDSMAPLLKESGVNLDVAAH